MLASLRDDERVISAARSRQVRTLRNLGRRRCQPRADELASLLDISVGKARELLETAWRTPELSDQMAELESGDWSFDRAAAHASLIGAGADAQTLESARSRDIAGMRKLKALQVRITRRDEARAHEERHVRTWPSLDQAAGFLKVQLTSPDWQTVTTALDRRGDLLPRDETVTAEQRRADALVALAHDFLDSRLTPRGRGSAGVVTVMIDPTLATPSNGEAGVTIPAGPRVGPETLDEIMCEGSVEVIVEARTGVPLSVGPTSRVVPPKTRRFVMARDGGCVVDGCNSRYRLEVHHLIPRSQHGTHDPENLVTLCWYHHHVSVHGQRMTLDPNSPPKRRRLIPAGRSP